MFKKIYWIFKTQVGFDILCFYNSLRGLPKYLIDLYKFKKIYKGKLNYLPCLNDRFEKLGFTSSEYFWQDLLVSQWIFNANPRKHADIGSRIDGFVAHIASFRHLEVLDIRKIKIKVSKVTFRQIDLMSSKQVAAFVKKNGYFDSLSCLHVLEHFGLGRYGDKVNRFGYEQGLQCMAKLLEKNGILYLSTQVGPARVEFNSNFVFQPNHICNIFARLNFKLIKLAILDKNGKLKNILKESKSNNFLMSQDNLAIFVAKKLF